MNPNKCWVLARICIVSESTNTSISMGTIFAHFSLAWDLKAYVHHWISIYHFGMCEENKIRMILLIQILQIIHNLKQSDVYLKGCYFKFDLYMIRSKP